MKATLAIVFLVFFSKAIGQKEFTWYPDQYNKEFDSKEIRDSGFSSVNIYFHYSDHIGDESWRDTLFLAKFNSQERPTYQKSINSIYDSTVKFFFYFNNGHLQKEVKRGYSLNSPNHILIDSTEYDNDGKVLKHSRESIGGKKKYQYLNTYKYNSSGQLVKEKETGGENEITTEYFYNKNRKKEKGVYINGKNSSIYLYKYDSKDSLTEIKTIESNGNLKDSIILKYEYDNQGNQIRESRYLSPTYVKTFRIECTTGDYFDNIYEYDSIGRKIYEASVLDKQRIAYTSIDHTTTRYYDFGYIEESFDSKGKKYHTSVYNSYTADVWGKKIIREMYNLSSKTTIFCLLIVSLFSR